MNIVADESVDVQIVSRLRVEGHNVEYVAELNPGVDDESALRKSLESNALLLTSDKDFGELVYRQGSLHSGILLIRFGGLAPERKADLVVRAFAEHHHELQHSFAVLSTRALRVRNIA